MSKLVISAAIVISGLTTSGIGHAGDNAGRQVNGNEDEYRLTGQSITGYALIGISPGNQSYAARPDNSGYALMRYAGHTDINLIGNRLSLSIDANLFTDGTQHGAAKFAPSELDFTWVCLRIGL